MRGSPFTFSNFALGLNVLDSPYTLKQGETRDCLNVISTPKGAVKKRLGSTIFAPGGRPFFPTSLTIVDTFERANEDPLENVKWSALKFNTAVQKGRIGGNGYVTKVGVKIAGAWWNVTKQVNPAVSVQISTLVAAEEGIQLLIWACLTEEGESAYFVQAQKLLNTEKWRVTLKKKKEGIVTPEAGLGTVPEVTLKVGDKLGITVRESQVTAWRYNGATTTWESLVNVEDTTYTEGYGAVSMENPVTETLRLKNFTLQEAEKAPASSEFTSLLPCIIGEASYLIATSGKKIFSINEKAEIVDITDAEPVTEGKRWSIIQGTENKKAGEPGRETGGPVYLSNGVDPPRTWSGGESGKAKVKVWKSKEEGEQLETPKAKYLVYHQDRVWAAGIKENETALRWSGITEAKEGIYKGLKVADPTNWPKENLNFLEQDDGYPITGLGTVGPYVIVFKKHRTWIVFDLNEGENRQISDTIGCIAPRSVVETPMGTFFLTPDQGVYVTNGSKVQEISQKVRPLLQGLDPVEPNNASSPRAANVSELEKAAGGYLNNHFYLTYKAQDGSFKTLDYDLQLKSWWLHDIAANQWTPWEVKGETFLYLAVPKVKTGIVKAFVPGIYQDSGVNYTGNRGLACFWCSSWEPFWQYFMRHRFQQPQVKKRIRTLFVDGKGELVVKAFKGFNKTPAELKGVVDNNDIAKPESPVKLGNYPGNEGTEKEYQAARFYAIGASRIWCFMFGNNSSAPMEVDTYAADLNFRKA